MPPDERSSRVLDRCDRHPGSPAVARCDGCGRPMCLACSTPVRGKAFGAECLAEVVGQDAPEATRPVARDAGRGVRTLAQMAFGLATLATVLPWSRFGPGSGAFGAWTRSGRWSTVAAIAAIAGLVLVSFLRRPRPRAPSWDTMAASLGALVAVASLLAVLFPPAFSRPWLGPWFAIGFGALACAASLVAGLTGRVPRTRDI